MKPCKGFTLVEMAIVLVIIALISAGILLGRSLLRQSQISSIIQDEQLYVHAAMQFKEKYGYLPGDFPHATDYWGAAAGIAFDNYSVTCYGNTTATSIATCNGDGNGHVYLYSSADYANSPERFLFWQHLSDAGLIPGKYTGKHGGGPLLYAEHNPGFNCPVSRMDAQVGFGVVYAPPLTGDNVLYDGVYNHMFDFGRYQAGMQPIRAVLTASEALAFDTKYDDGLPAYGTIRNAKSGLTVGTCTTSDVSSAAAYDLSLVGEKCAVNFTTGF